MKLLKMIGLLTVLLGNTVQAETVFVTLEKDNAIAVVDPLEGKLLKTFEVGRQISIQRIS